jgi:hypothetical protein
MEKIKLNIVAISHSVTQSHNYAVILSEEEGGRRLPIVIGGFEAQAIAVAVENMNPNRPLTHDLFKNALTEFNINILEVIVSDLSEGIFYAQLVCEQEGNVSIIDSRTSDAIALAVRFNAPIYTYEFVMEAAGVQVEDGVMTADAPKKKPSRKGGTYTSMSVSDLEEALNRVLEAEDYEKAAKIRDELNRRRS